MYSCFIYQLHSFDKSNELCCCTQCSLLTIWPPFGNSIYKLDRLLSLKLSSFSFLFLFSIRRKRTSKRRRVFSLTVLIFRSKITRLQPPPLTKPSAERNRQIASRTSPTRLARCAPASVAHIAVNANTQEWQPHSHLWCRTRSTTILVILRRVRQWLIEKSSSFVLCRWFWVKNLYLTCPSQDQVQMWCATVKPRGQPRCPSSPLFWFLQESRSRRPSPLAAC